MKIYIGESRCTSCGKRHKRVFEIDGKPYGSSCAIKLIGKELSAPLWLYQLAEEWVIKDVEISAYLDVSEASVNFFNYYETDTNYDGHRLWNKAIKVQGRSVKVDWQYEINDYIISRYEELKSQ